MTTAEARRSRHAKLHLNFLGTRGEIELRSERHMRHSVLCLSAGRGRVLVDCGDDWLGELDALSPAAVVLTHAHRDHAGGLRRGAPCPVYATDATWERLSRYDIVDRERVACRKPVEVEGLAFEAFPVAHSLLAPAVAYRISAGGRTILYAPDLVAIDDEGDALRALVLYVGDGASIVRPIVRRRDGVLIGHASIRQQIDWCRRAGLRRALFTHCGSQILRDEDGAEARVAALGREQGIDAALAHDGLVLELR